MIAVAPFAETEPVTFVDNFVSYNVIVEDVMLLSSMASLNVTMIGAVTNAFDPVGVLFST